MKVVQIKDRMRVKPDQVHVIPPDADLSILNGILHLMKPSAPRGLRLPIDHFLRSLADDRKEQCVGVVLSGMGSDGLAGMRAIKESGGFTLAQEPAEAKYDSMPKSVIDAGLADIVAPASELPERIIGVAVSRPLRAGGSLQIPDKGGCWLGKILVTLRARTKQDFSAYKKSTMYRRIERRMNIHKIDRIETYARMLQENPQETALLFKELLIGVTSFFRDPEAWEHLRTRTLPELLSGLPDGGALRAWVPGCSTGEEAYSLAITFKEAVEALNSSALYSLQIFATDLDPDAIEAARQGTYTANIEGDVPGELLARYFTAENGSYRVVKSIREMVVFATQNVIGDPPFTRIDLLTCRNLLIYLEQEQQSKLLALFAYSLNEGGVLFLGSAESIGGASDHFYPLDGKFRIFRRADRSGKMFAVMTLPHFQPLPPALPAPEASISSSPSKNLQDMADQFLLSRFTPAAVLVNEAGEILYINGRTGNYLEPAAGKVNWNVLAMAREGLRNELTIAFQTVRKHGSITLRNLKVEAGGKVRAVDVSIQAIEEPQSLRGMVMLTFSEQNTPPRKCSTRGKKGVAALERQEHLEHELEQMRFVLRTTVEEMQASQEELKSANEELQSTNEELQSTNEELTTSREEMQSLNEELQTLNAELQDKVDELSMTNDDMENLLNSTEIATIFLDEKFRIRRFTPQATAIVKLIPGDVGRPLADLVSDLPYPALFDEAAEVLRTLVYVEREISVRDGRWFMMRINPYRTRDNRIDGVVLTFHDISQAKRLEARLRETSAKFEELAGIGTGVVVPANETKGRL
ncbi:Chemotaxis protein methyltransferase [Fundidesulfovibrio magnetotacticus]|uniref:Chemotaxis protein methyltransferase n=2 Tax=Fundidesulfovibrio magnetotacticus TaxID=2730080 RepID=A0A6V8LVX8_9BACT|nr:Chemotaxis protein methyltransferase [Fundidesulfovibrio magnetotacticus]